MELRTFLSIFLGFSNLTSIHAPTEENTTTSTISSDNLASANNETIIYENRTANQTEINATVTALAAPSARDCCCHKEEPHYCDKSCQAFVIFALLSILLVAFLQANPVMNRRRRRRSMPSLWQLGMMSESEWDTQMNRFYAEVVEKR